MKFLAAIQGIDLDDRPSASDKESDKDSDDAPASQIKESKPINKPSAGNKNLIFKDPREYEKMSQEERDALTQKMMSHWRKWASDSEVEKASGNNC